jgi:hypothetical protein
MFIRFIWALEQSIAKKEAATNPRSLQHRKYVHLIEVKARSNCKRSL